MKKPKKFRIYKLVERSKLNRFEEEKEEYY